MVDNGGAPRPTIGAPVRGWARGRRVRELPLPDDLAIFSASKKCPWHRYFLQRSGTRKKTSRRRSATQMRVTMMQWSGPPHAARRTKIFSTVGSVGGRTDEKSRRKERITASDSRRETRARTHRAAQKDDSDASSAPETHTPSLRLSNSLTACGLARPPDARMT